MQSTSLVPARSLTISLRGENHKAERLTKTNYVALGSLVREKGRPMPNLENESAKRELAEQMLERFSDPAFLKRLCYSLLAIFPSLENNDLVWFQPEGNMTPPWGTSLEPEEILEIITAVANALQAAFDSAQETPVETDRINTFLPEEYVRVLRLQEQEVERTKLAKIAELETAIAELKQT